MDNSRNADSASSYAKRTSSLRLGKNHDKVLFNLSLLKTLQPKIVIHEFALSILSLIPFLIFSKLMHSKFILWGHTYDRSKGFRPAIRVGDKLRLLLMRHAEAVIVYSNSIKNEISNYMPAQKIFVANNTIDINPLIRIRESLELEGKPKIKNQIGFKHKYNITYIGKLTLNKRPELLIELYEKITSRIQSSICFHFIGEGEMMFSLQEIIKRKKYTDDIKIHGPIYDNTKSGEFLYSSDLMVVLGPLGLAIIHSFCFDLPVCTFGPSEKTHHGPEIEYLINNETGFLVGKKSVDEVSEVIISYLEDEKLQKEIKSNIREKVATLTIENMITGFMGAIQYCGGTLIK